MVLCQKLLKIVEKILHWFFECSQKYSKSFIIFFLCLILVSGYFSKDVKLALRSEEMNNHNTPSYHHLQNLNQEFGVQENVLLLLKKQSAFDQGDYCLLWKWRNKVLRDSNIILEVGSIFDLRFIDYHNGILFYPRVVSEPCQKKVPEIESGTLTQDERILDNPLYSYYHSPKLNETIVYLKIQAIEDPTAHFKYDYEELNKFIQETKKQLPYDIRVSGSIYFQDSVLQGLIRSEMLNGIAAIFIFFGYFYFYRSYRASFLLLITIIFTTTVIKGGMALLGHRMDSLTSCLFFMMTIAVIEDYIFLSFLIKEGKGTSSFYNACKKILLPSFFTSLTTAVGFGSLMVSSNESIFRFGAWTAMGTLFEWTILFGLLPALIKEFPSLNNWFKFKEVPNVGTWLKRLVKIKPSRHLTILTIIIPFIFLYFNHQVILQYDVFSIFKDNHEIKLFAQDLKKSRGSEGDLSLVFLKDGLQNRHILEKIKKEPFVTHAYSYYDYEDYIQKYPKEIHSLLIGEFNQSDMGKLFTGPHNTRAILTIKTLASTDIEAFDQKVKSICQGECQLVSEAIVAKDYSLSILKTIYDSFGFCLIIVFILMLFLCLAINSKLLWPILISTFWAPLALFSFIFTSKFEIDLVASVALSVVVGITGDNAIQFLMLSKNNLQESVENYGVASLQTIILMIIISVLLLASYFKPAINISYLITLGVIFIYLGDILVLNGLLKFMKSKN